MDVKITPASWFFGGFVQKLKALDGHMVIEGEMTDWQVKASLNLRGGAGNGISETVSLVVPASDIQDILFGPKPMASEIDSRRFISLAKRYGVLKIGARNPQDLRSS